MSQWGLPTVLVNKLHYNKMRMCNDVRKLYDKTIYNHISHVEHKLFINGHWEKTIGVFDYCTLWSL